MSYRVNKAQRWKQYCHALASVAVTMSDHRPQMTDDNRVLPPGKNNGLKTTDTYVNCKKNVHTLVTLAKVIMRLYLLAWLLPPQQIA